MSSDESRRKIVAWVRGKTVSVTGDGTYWRTNPEGRTGFGNALVGQTGEPRLSDTQPRAPRSLEEALAAMEARAADAWPDDLQPDVTPRDVPFDIDIEDEGNGSFLLIYEAADGSLFGNDTWHASQEEAEDFAMKQFGVQPNEWQRIRDAPNQQ